MGPTVVVSHVSVLQVLVSYFRSTPVTECTGIDIPMHTVLKFVPLRGGGWLETHHELGPDVDGEPSTSTTLKPPVRAKSHACLPSKAATKLAKKGHGIEQ